MTKVGVVGFGQMGRFISELLADRCCVLAYDPAAVAGADKGVQLAPLSDVANQQIVFLFPPISQFATCCRQLAPFLRPGTTVVEGCSVMSNPAATMRETLPAFVDLVACHPLFGPQSGARGVRGLKAVVAPLRGDGHRQVTTLFASLGVDVVQMTPEAHDRAMARTQALEQVVGRALARLGIRHEAIDLPGYRKLVELKEMLEHDSDDVFFGVERDNPFAPEVVGAFASAVADIVAEIRGDAPCGRGRS